jgi:hypothetical protein
MFTLERRDFLFYLNNGGLNMLEVTRILNNHPEVFKSLFTLYIIAPYRYITQSGTHVLFQPPNIATGNIS